ncbi:Isochorismatase hydrolase [Gautieria morchelliformis]|nr:Isochorismatase hydrolase [Gautieria morchelliformis]
MAATITRGVAKIAPRNTVFFACDLQIRLKPAIHAFDNVVATANKMLKVAKTLDVPVVVTEQNPKGSSDLIPVHRILTQLVGLGPTVPELGLSTLGSLHIGTYPKSLFSMVTPDLIALLSSRQPSVKAIVLFGIEAHVCVLQTTLDLLELQYDVHVLVDGVSSCNKEEVPWALERMRQAGAQITTSESMAFQLMVDSANANFKPFAAIIKEEKEATKQTLQTLLPLQ